MLTDEDLWRPTAEPAEPGTPEAQLQEAAKALVLGEADRAEALASAWIERNDLHPMLPRAYLIRADARVALDDEYEALFDYEVIARLYAGSDVFVTALQREFEIGKQYLNGRKRKLWGVRWASAVEDGEELLIRVQERLPGSRLAEQAGMELADYYFKKGDVRLAAEAYDLFIENYPDSDQISKARLRQISSNLAAYKGPRYDPSGLDEAKLKLREIQMIEPATAQRIGSDGILFRINESEATKLLVNARWYLQTRDPIAAERTIRRLIVQHPNTVAAQDALDLVPKVMEKLPKTVIATLPDYEALRVTALRASATAPADPVRPETSAQSEDPEASDENPDSEPGSPERGPTEEERLGPDNRTRPEVSP